MTPGIGSHINLQEKISGIVERVTFHAPETGMTVLKVAPFQKIHNGLVTVIVHQAKVFAGATMEFTGHWTHHPKHGDQFKAEIASEKKPANSNALEKYLGSGLIEGVGPATAKKIVSHFKGNTLDVFENKIEKLMQVPGIAEKKLEKIKSSWEEHKAIRDVMLFLQGHGISTIFAVKIYKTYGDKSISIVSNNPYRLAQDIYGIGFFSADKIALSMGLERTGLPRIEAGIKHVLSAAKEQGHCYLKELQIHESLSELLNEKLTTTQIQETLKYLHHSNQIMARNDCYYSKTLYYNELNVAEIIKSFLQKKESLEKTVDLNRVINWLDRYCEQQNIDLAPEQRDAVIGISNLPISILTGGPGCGKTTTTKVLVKLFQAMKLKITLTAPTGRAAQRMTEVVGPEAKTIHRLLEWNPQESGFKKNKNNPLETDVLIADECSMLDISLAFSLLDAIPKNARIILIGDPDQLPSVGAGNVLNDLIKSKIVPCFRLTKVFRQAAKSKIISYAHQINQGLTPQIVSPLAQASAFKDGEDCLFLDTDEATLEQLKFLERIKWALKKEGKYDLTKPTENQAELYELYNPEINLNTTGKFIPDFIIPEKFQHVDIEKVVKAETKAEELMAVLKSIHPWSTVHYGLTGVDSILRLYTKTIPEWLGPNAEIQILTPQVRGTLGSINLNNKIQETVNPSTPGKAQIKMGEKILRTGDSVIQTRNNYDLGVFNGDIGKILAIDTEELSLEVSFGKQEAARSVYYNKEDISDLNLAYAITVHKSQGSEFQVVIMPVALQHFNMLYRNLIYTGLTRAKKLAILVGSRKALNMAIKKIDNRERQTHLTKLILP